MTRPPAADALVGLVVVSHSRPLAEAAVELALQMVHGQGPAVAVAAGLDDGTLGTDALAIKSALEEVDGPAGVVVVMDLGSALLSAELALDLADDPALRDRVTLSAAPLVEGLVAAVVTAAGGAPASEVAAEAARALAAKQAQLGAGPSGAPSSATALADLPASTSGSPASSAEVEVTPEHGLHARPVARLAAELRGLDAAVTLMDLTTGAGPAPATSPTSVALLGALRGHRLRVNATGPDAAEALRRVVALAELNFGDPPGADRDDAPARGEIPPAHGGGSSAGRGAEIRGVGAAPGVAVGPVRHLRAAAPDRGAAPTPSGDPRAEEGALTEALDRVREATAAVRDRTAREVGEAEAAIFAAHLALLDDDAVVSAARSGIAQGKAAATAWADAVDALHDRMAALPDPYQRARAGDLRAVGDQVLHALLGTSGAARPTGTGVLVTADLTPEQAASLDPAEVQAAVLAGSSATSHAAILTRARGVPAVVAAGDHVLAVPEGTVVAVDGEAGTVVVDPDPAVVADHERRRGVLERRRAAAAASAAAPARTRDGTHVPVACNVGSLPDARVGAEQGAEGAGLVRTELCFVGRSDEPSVEEQESVYRSVAEALGGRRITLRTLDVGGDKPLPFLPVPHEDNPFLGLRGLRLGLAHEDVLRRQLTAVVRAGRRTPVSVMFPMVSTVAELRRARALLDEVLAAEGGCAVDGEAGLRVGIMVEVPATALNLAAFAGLVDFVSIGTNDLTQYALAVERGNPHVAALADPLDPGVLALVGAAARAGEGRFAVAVCGEAASDPVAVPLLLGLGVAELSVAPGSVPAVKQRVRELDLATCSALACDALAAGSAAGVRALVRERLGG